MSGQTLIFYMLPLSTQCSSSLRAADYFSFGNGICPELTHLRMGRLAPCPLKAPFAPAGERTHFLQMGQDVAPKGKRSPTGGSIPIPSQPLGGGQSGTGSADVVMFDNTDLCC